MPTRSVVEVQATPSWLIQTVACSSSPAPPITTSRSPARNMSSIRPDCISGFWASSCHAPPLVDCQMPLPAWGTSVQVSSRSEHAEISVAMNRSLPRATTLIGSTLARLGSTDWIQLRPSTDVQTMPWRTLYNDAAPPTPPKPTATKPPGVTSTSVTAKAPSAGNETSLANPPNGEPGDPGVGSGVAAVATGVVVLRLVGVGVLGPIGVPDARGVGLDAGVGPSVGTEVSAGVGVGVVTTCAVGPQATAIRAIRTYRTGRISPTRVPPSDGAASSATSTSDVR